MQNLIENKKNINFSIIIYAQVNVSQRCGKYLFDSKMYSLLHITELACEGAFTSYLRFHPILRDTTAIHQKRRIDDGLRISVVTRPECTLPGLTDHSYA